MSLDALLELASRDTLYHATNSLSALYVLKSGEFKLPLTETNTSETKIQVKDKQGNLVMKDRHLPGLFYLSTARSLSSGYIADRDKNLNKVGETTVFVLDWPIIRSKNRGVVIKPIEYWGLDATGRKYGSGSEQEERIFSNNRALKIKGAIKEILLYVDRPNFRMRQVYSFCLKNRIPIKLFTEHNFQGFLRRKERDEDRKLAIERLQKTKQDRYMSGLPGKTPSSSKTAEKYWFRNTSKDDRRYKELDALTVMVNAKDYGKLPKKVREYFYNYGSLQERFTNFIHNIRGESKQGSDSTDKFAILLKKMKAKSVKDFFDKLDAKWEKLRDKYKEEERKKAGR